MPSPIGLDIGSSSITAVQIAPSRRGPAVLERVGRVAVPPGALRDGEVADPDLVAAALRELWAATGFRGRRVALGVSNQQVVVRQVDLPYLPEKELRHSLQFQVDEAIPIPVEQAILDFHVIETFSNDEGERFIRILLVAALRDMVDTLVMATTAAGLEPVLVDLDAFAMLRSLAPESARGLLDEPAGELLVDVGSVVTNLLVHAGGVPRFVRILLLGGESITQDLVATLDISREEAEQRKAQVGILDPVALLSAGHDARLIAERGSRLIEEIRGSLDYYAAQMDAAPVRRVVLTGGGSRIPGLAARLAEVLSVPVDEGRPLQELRIGAVGLTRAQLVAMQPDLAVAVGLALGAGE